MRDTSIPLPVGRAVGRNELAVGGRGGREGGRESKLSELNAVDTSTITASS